jgi:hypothetical protein
MSTLSPVLTDAGVAALKEIVATTYQVVEQVLDESVEQSELAEQLEFPIGAAVSFDSAFTILMRRNIEYCHADVVCEAAHPIANGLAVVHDEFGHGDVAQTFWITFPAFYIFSVGLAGLFLREVFSGSIHITQEDTMLYGFDSGSISEFALRPRVQLMDSMQYYDPNEAVSVRVASSVQYIGQA